MKQFAIIGLSTFGCRAVEELIPLGVDILIIDKDEEIIQNYKDKVASAYIVDITKIDAIEKVIPKTVDIAIVDLGNNREASILITNLLHGMGIKQIVAKAESDGHGNVLKLVGATMVVFPNREAVKRIIPQLISPLLLNYMPISKSLVIAEVKMPAKYTGKSLIEADLRSKLELTVIAIRNSEEYTTVAPGYVFIDGDIALVTGSEEHISQLIEHPLVPRSGKIVKRIRNIFSRFRIGK